MQSPAPSLHAGAHPRRRIRRRGSRRPVVAAIRVAGGLIAVVLAACGSPSVAPTKWTGEVTWSSAHFVYHARPDDGTVGPEVIDDLESNAALVASGWLQLPEHTSGPIHYFKYRSFDELVAARSVCEDRACTHLFADGRVEVHSSLPVELHELVHAYTLPAFCATEMFREGLAVSLTCDPPTEPGPYATTSPAALPSSWRDLTSFGGANPTSYQPAGLLVTWLVDTWGRDAFLRFYRQVGCGVGPDAIASTFIAAYGETLDDVWAAMVAAPRRRGCLSLSACAAGAASGAVTLTNRSSGFRLAVPVADPGAAGAVIRAEYAAGAEPPVIRPCKAAGAFPDGGGQWPADPASWSPVVLLSFEQPVAVALRTFDGSTSDPAVDLALDVTPVPLAGVPAPGGGDCAGTTPIVVSDTRATVLLWPRNQSFVLGLQSSAAEPSQTTRIRHDGGGEARLEACSACADGTLQGCADASTTDGVNAPWLRVTWAPAVPRPLKIAIEWL